MQTINITDVPEDFPRRAIPAVVSGVQSKIGVVLSGGKYYAGETPEARCERWDICEDLARQLVPVAQKDGAKHPEHSVEQTLGRMRVSVSQKGWISEAELDWVLKRILTLLEW
ncbi:MULTISPECIES: hypothetical protein [unclassified Cupriavidus]|uniref:hypothetical protein n=1 Tax=unclassified Cupriavidus TaxID=2640874 RepID=UPI001C0015D2|nr:MULTISPECIES: hypothetical protein [unclassified Cupriavidus]MCA3186915.1 hypothetical protein [Cupriavidus sp.]MCA3192981.1 hypothetical protein [Cupriavidus sp.]MCA3195833.1 hypothetical protein [Cupriavidus sp.]MCA3204734.1 hypothetical protein [Cupriavidus sp.]MCA3206866.1 hypothetical protein [Cupriavidus sp.]